MPDLQTHAQSLSDLNGTPVFVGCSDIDASVPLD
jgi:hypothetical protein